MSTNDKIPTATHARDTAEFIEDDDGNVYLSFSTTPGRGYGKSMIPINEIPSYISFLKKVMDDTTVVTKHDEHSDDMLDVMKRTFQDKDGILSWKTSTGRGTKPTRILKSDGEKFVKFLKDANKEMVEYTSKYIES